VQQIPQQLQAVVGLAVQVNQAVVADVA
jgi:hypothetical protein